jgi:hypothetical protein
MIVKILKAEAREILSSHLKTIFPNKEISCKDSYGDFEFSVLNPGEKQAEE